jgi:hypothetical protein
MDLGEIGYKEWKWMEYDTKDLPSASTMFLLSFHPSIFPFYIFLLFNSVSGDTRGPLAGNDSSVSIARTIICRQIDHVSL